MVIKKALKEIISNDCTFDNSNYFAIANFSKDGKLKDVDLIDNYSEIFLNYNDKDNISYIVDMNGNKLLSNIEKEFYHEELYFSDKDIIAKAIDSKKNSRVIHFRYLENDKKLEVVKDFLGYEAGVIFREVFNNQLFILTDCHNDKNALYSIEKGEIVSPFVDTISSSYNDDGSITFVLEDNIEKEELKTTLTTLINSSGKICDNVYDSYFDKFIAMDKSRPITLTYEKLREDATERLEKEIGKLEDKKEQKIYTLLNNFGSNSDNKKMQKRDRQN